MQTQISILPKTWLIERYENCKGITEEMRERMIEYLLSLHGAKESTKDDYLSKIKMLGIALTERGIPKL